MIRALGIMGAIQELYDEDPEMFERVLVNAGLTEKKGLEGLEN